jgi:hypothetical protein
MPHPFIREKWVLRKVAERYLPKGFAFRGKVGFPATVFKRMTVHPDFFRESYICDLFGLSEAEKAHLLATTERRTIVRMMFLEVWAQLFFCGRPPCRGVRTATAARTPRGLAGRNVSNAVERVTPVVKTSSMRITKRPRTISGRRESFMHPATARRLSPSPSAVRLGVHFWRRSAGMTLQRMCRATDRASSHV